MREKYTATDAQDDWELEQLFRKLGGERASKAIARRKKSKPLGRPEDNHISLLVEMVQIIQRDGYDFGNKQAQSKAAREVAKKRPKGRADVSKTLIKKFNAALERARLISLWEGKKLSITIQVERDRWAPFGHLPEGAKVLAELDGIERELITALQAFGFDQEINLDTFNSDSAQLLG